MKYKITVEKVAEQDGEKYRSNERLYEQTVEGDDAIVSSVVATVLDYTQTKQFPPVLVQKGE